MSGFTLHEITEGMAKIEFILDQFEDPDEIVEQRELWSSQIQDLQELFEEKVIGIGAICKNYEVEAAVYTAEIKRLKRKKEIALNKTESLNGYCLELMLQAGVEKVQGKTFSAKVKKLPAKVGEVDLDILPDDYKRTVPETFEPDKRALLKDYKEGVAKDPDFEIEGVEFETGRKALGFS